MAFLDADGTARQWSNDSFTPEAQQARRADMLEPSRSALARLVPSAKTQASEARAALDSALDAALSGSNDAGRVVAREAVWPRLQARLLAGESLDTMVRGCRNPVELEALAAIAPSEMARLHPNAVQRSAEEWEAEVRQAVAARYMELPEIAGQFTGHAAQAATAEQVDSWAHLGEALLAGKRGADVGGAIYSRLLRADESATPIYDMLMGR